MIHTASDSKSTNGTAPVRKLDAVIIGTGVAGLYQLHQLREQGLNVRAYDSASDVGGTWYWNRYPGARFDSESYIYQYLFSEELYKGWSWSEKFPGQPEIERWLNYVADRLDLRKDIQFNTTITSTLRRCDQPLDREDRHRRDDRHAVLGDVLRPAIGTPHRYVSRAGHIHGAARAHRPLAEGAGQLRRQACRRRRDRRRPASRSYKPLRARSSI